MWFMETDTKPSIVCESLRLQELVAHSAMLGATRVPKLGMRDAFSRDVDTRVNQYILHGG